MRQPKGSIGKDRAGLGGFFEAILAIMIVTSGFTILLVSVSLVQADADREGDDPHARLLAIGQRLLGDERIFQQPYVLILSNSYLWNEIAEDQLSDFEGYVVTLIIDVEDPRSITLAQKAFDSASGEVINVRIPVNVRMTPSMVSVGILELRVGA